MPLKFPFDNSYARLPDRLFARVAPIPVPDARLIAFNHDLAMTIGLTGQDSDAGLAAIFAGNTLPDGAEPLAQLYAGHQFGGFVPQLGDGRAVLLGEVVAPDGSRHDIQLKGSGRTPFSRGGDGRAWLGPVLREYVVSEAMHALGIPTTRALAAVSTGEKIFRETELPGAVLTRVAASHIRVGTFQALAARGDTEGLRALFEHAVERHYPDAQTPLDLLNSVIKAQAHLIPAWMSMGFIHGVMNTDNCTISGQTIDYGPCAFLDDYHPHKVFSSIDHMGRYAYMSQPDIVVWNMAQLATALVPLMADEDQAVTDFTAAIHAMPDMLQSNWLARFSAKIGLSAPSAEAPNLVASLLEIMARNNADFTNAFRALATGKARDQFTDPADFDAWEESWKPHLGPDAEAIMNAANPDIIPRNHRIEQMIDAAVSGDFAPFHRLNSALAKPFVTDEDNADLRRPPAPSEVVAQTFCGT